MSRRRVSIGIVLIVTGVLPFAYDEFRMHLHKWDPLVEPVKLSRGAELLTPEFTTDLSGFYNVSLMFAPLHVELEECLVGNSGFSSFCQGRTDRLDLDWAVLRQSANGETPVMAYQPYHPGSFEGAGSVETVLGGFEAHKGSVYRIGVRVKEIAPELASASPRVHVEAIRFIGRSGSSTHR